MYGPIFRKPIHFRRRSGEPGGGPTRTRRRRTLVIRDGSGVREPRPAAHHPLCSAGSRPLVGPVTSQEPDSCGFAEEGLGRCFRGQCGWTELVAAVTWARVDAGISGNGLRLGDASRVMSVVFMTTAALALRARSGLMGRPGLPWPSAPAVGRAWGRPGGREARAGAGQSRQS